MSRSPSIRHTLLIRCGAGVGVLLCILSASVFVLVERSLYRELDEALGETASLLSNQVELENGAITHEWQEGIGRNPTILRGGLFQFWNEKQGGTVRSPDLHGDLPRFTGANGKPLLRSILLPDGRHGRALGVRVLPFVLPEDVEKMKARGEVIDPVSLPHTLVVARDEEPLLRTLGRLKLILGVGTLCALGLGFWLINRAVRVTLRPLDEFAAEIRDRAENRLDAMLEVPDTLPVELTGLAQDFGALLKRVASIRDRERDFIRHAAHELRTPIAGLQAVTELALSQSRDAAAYAEHLKACQKTAGELGVLVQKLSALARIGQVTDIVKLERIDLTAVVAECQTSFTRAAEKRNLTFENVSDGQPVFAQADPALLRIVLNNLFDNAVSYAPVDSAIRIGVNEESGRCRIALENRIEDSSEDHERLFEPLFRREASRHDASSHLGIGLTLSRDAAMAMGGALQAASRREGSIQFVLQLAKSD